MALPFDPLNPNNVLTNAGALSSFNPLAPNPQAGLGVTGELINLFNVSNLPTVPDSENNTTYGINTTLPKSAFGKSIVSWLTFKGGTYSSLNDGTVVTIQDITLSNCIISVKQAKNIVLSKVNGRNGTVKTYMGMDDFNIRVVGTIIGNNGQYPAEDVQTLKTITNAPIAVKVSCPFLNEIHNISFVTIQGSDINQDEGGYSQQRFSIDMLSDDDSDTIISTNLNGSLNPYVTK